MAFLQAADEQGRARRFATAWRSQQNGHVSANQPVALAHLPKGGRWPEYAFPGVGSLDTLIVERDDGMFAIGWADDAPGPFASRRFAEAVAARLVVPA